jgi:hypothetical protein
MGHPLTDLATLIWSYPNHVSLDRYSCRIAFPHSSHFTPGPNDPDPPLHVAFETNIPRTDQRPILTL